MKPNDLRIGNLILSPNGGTFQVLELGKYAATVQRLDPEKGLTGCEVSADYTSMEGIPLTPERLEAAGWKTEHDVYTNFTKDTIHRTAYTIEVGELHFELERAGEVWLFAVAGVGVAEFQFFHQIQNAIFALTGEELTLKQ